MSNKFLVAVAVVAVLFAACSKESVQPLQEVAPISNDNGDYSTNICCSNPTEILNIIAINKSKSQVVNVKLKSMEK